MNTPRRSSSSRVPQLCHRLGYTSLRVLPLGAALAAAAFFCAVVAHAGSCCQAPATATPAPASGAPKSCCAAEAPAPSKPAACCAADAAQTAGEAPAEFTARSLYQADGSFTTDAGRPFRLAELRGRPVVVTMFFATCGYACPLTVTDLRTLQDQLPSALRRDTVFVLVSFDPQRDTVAALAQYRGARQLDANWTLLRGDDEAVRELAALLGVKYKREADGSFAHSNLFTLLNREGEVVHQRLGLQGGLAEAQAALSRLP